MMNDITRMPWSAWLEESLRVMSMMRPESICIAAACEDGTVFTGYYNADAQDKAVLPTIPSVDKGKYACRCVSPALFALFALAGVSPPASQKTKITRISIAGRCKQFCRSRNVFRRQKARRECWRISKGFAEVCTHFCPSKPYLPLSIDGIDIL